jgi:5S rRNA maturation endonuclease (ribonuclease M5)
MKYQSSNTRNLFELDFIAGKRYICPECSHTRKKEKNKDLQYFRDANRAYCFHCNTTFFEYKAYEKKEYTVPQWSNKTDLTDKAVKWLTSRGVSQDTLVKMKIYSDVSYMPQVESDIEVICFPYFGMNEDDLVNIKYRGPKKSFKLHSGAKLIWYNFPVILAYDEIIICEGEIDALTFVENKFENVISVPNGANKNLQYLDDSIDLFKDKKIILATDNDTKGIELRDELIRRFGPENCYLLNFRECKDANEFYIKYGGLDFKDMVKNANAVPIEGNIEVNSFYSELEDLFENGMVKGAMVQFEEIDKYITWETKRLAIVSGRPGCFTKDQLVHTSQGVRPISEIKVGDFVLTYNHRRKINEYRIVTNTPIHPTHTEKLYKITLKDGSEIKVTGNHEFFTGREYLGIEYLLLQLESETNQKQDPYMEAFTLNLDDIVSYEEIPIEETYDLTVDGNSNYYLATNTKPILVHNSGKSEFVDYLITRLNLIYGWKACFFTPENFPLKYHYSKLYEKLIGKPFSKAKSSTIEFDMAYEYINNNFFYILPENDLTIKKILDNAKLFVRSKGIKILVIDPYNKLDHQQGSSQTETQYISKFLDELTMFAKLNDVLIFLVAHPNKLIPGQIPTLYNISGSAHFYNKTDYGFTVHRVFDEQNIMTNDIEVHWQKIKFKHLGEQGVSELRYNYVNGRFEPRGAVETWDNSNWLAVGEEQEFAQPNNAMMYDAPF